MASLLRSNIQDFVQEVPVGQSLRVPPFGACRGPPFKCQEGERGRLNLPSVQHATQGSADSYLYIYIDTYVRVCMCIHTCECMYVCMYVCTYVCIHTYIHTHLACNRCCWFRSRERSSPSVAWLTATMYFVPYSRTFRVPYHCRGCISFLYLEDHGSYKRSYR